MLVQWVFLPEPPIRKKLVLPPPVKVDYRAACFCHRVLIDTGFVCSVCLSSKCLQKFFSSFSDLVSLISIVIIFDLCLGPSSGLFPSDFPTEILCASLISCMHAMCPTHVILLYLVTLMMFGEKYKS